MTRWLKIQFACFACRKCFKVPYVHLPRHASGHIEVRSEPVLCPECGTEMRLMGAAFKAPPRTNTRQWLKVERLARAGVVFHWGGRGESGPGWRPRSLSEVDAFLASQWNELSASLAVGRDRRK